MIHFQMAMKLAFAWEAFSTARVPAADVHC